MTLNINLQDMPSLVLEKITSFLNHKQLLALEQVSKKLNSAVDCHFSFTDHLILGSLPTITQNENLGLTAEGCKFFFSFRKMIERCGPRVRNIQINVTDQFFLVNYCPYLILLGSRKLGGKCSNIEKIITSPKMVLEGMVGPGPHYIFNQQNITTVISNHHLDEVSNDKTSKLRSICLYLIEMKEQVFEKILRFYPNLEQICYKDENLKNFLKFLPEFIENGLKDLTICHDVTDFQDAKKLCDLGKNLRTLEFPLNPIGDDDPIITNLQPPTNVRIRMTIQPERLVLLNKSIYESVIACDIHERHYNNSGFSSLLKMKNLEEINNNGVQLMKIITLGSFPKLTNIKIDVLFSFCQGNSFICESTTLLAQLLANKGNQLTVIKMHNFCSLHLILKALKHCRAAMFVEISNPRDKLATTEDMLAILNLPNLQKLIISHRISFDDVVPSSFDWLRDLVKEATRRSKLFKLNCKPLRSDSDVEYSFMRIKNV